ncbi:NACHT domain-containing protein [Streptococcus wuxiensis]|uniref:NACHT domain-containing protein n=1 Tax=Streptococcus wuxiensis TaxID=3095078 RepID=A0ABU5FRP6_9STRE|nr:NACHT domain-containing protein [Streptococcus sp. 21WXBC0057M1]MDY4337165.1 NACHT domain-containing protein [Streptococcus sp. 21WXBC0057M1]
MMDENFNNDLASKFMNAIFDEYLSPLISKIANKLKITYNEVKIDLEIPFQAYLTKSYDKYSRIKTIIYGIEPKRLYDFFEVPFLEKGSELIKPTKTRVLTDISKFLIIEGSGGIGKSTLMKHLFLSELELKDYIPIFIELKDFNEEEHLDLEKLLLKKLNQFHNKFQEEYLDYALQSGCFLFLLDGYDELYSENQKEFFKKLNDFCDKYPENHYILSSRPYSESEFIEFQRFTVLKAVPFNKEQAISLITKIEYPDEELKNKFIRDLESGLYDRHESFASNPLLLNIMLSTYNDYAEIPQKLHLFYYQAFDTMLSKHDATKSYRRKMLSDLSSDTFKECFAIFCLLTYQKAKTEFTFPEIEEIFKKFPPRIKNVLNIGSFIHDLENCLCVLYKEGNRYKFSHRSFQEYFVAYFLNIQTDSKMRDYSFRLIESGKFRASADSVFFMLEDMNTLRFNSNILIPLLDKFEESKSDEEDLFEYYILNFPVKIEISPSPSDSSLGLGFIHTQDNFQSFIYYFFDNTINYTSYRTIDNNPLISFCKDNHLIEQPIGPEDIIENEELFDLFKKSWVGQKILSLTHYKQKLIEDLKKEDIVLED